MGFVVDENKLDDPRYIAQILYQNDPELEKLDLRGALDHSKKGLDMKIIMPALDNNTTLKVLDIRDNNIQGRYFKYIKEALMRNHTLERLYMDGNLSSLLSLQRLLKAVEEYNFTLLELQVDEKILTMAEVDILTEVMERNEEYKNNDEKPTPIELPPRPRLTEEEELQEDEDDKIEVINETVKATVYDKYQEKLKEDFTTKIKSNIDLSSLEKKSSFRLESDSETTPTWAKGKILKTVSSSNSLNSPKSTTGTPDKSPTWAVDSKLRSVSTSNSNSTSPREDTTPRWMKEKKLKSIESSPVTTVKTKEEQTPEWLKRSLKKSLEQTSQIPTSDSPQISIYKDVSSLTKNQTSVMTPTASSIKGLLNKLPKYSGPCSSEINRARINDKYLTEINLSNKKMKNETAKELFMSLENNRYVVKLSLQDNYLTDEIIPNLVSLLSKNSSIATLEIEGNLFQQKGIDEIIKGLELNKTLTDVGIGDPATDEQLDKVDEILDRNFKK